MKRMTWKRAAGIGLAIGAMLLTQASTCDDSHDSAPDPTPGTFVDLDKVPNSRPRGVKMPDGYRNIIIFCDGPNLVYETSRGGTASVSEGTNSNLQVVANDPRCAR